MSKPFGDVPVRPKKDTFLLVSSALLVLFTGGFLLEAFTRYHSRIEAISLTESRFVKTEWHLLKDLKAQTDQELLQKDQEIADLNRRYLDLVRHSGTPSELQRVETLLRQAEAQRRQILARRDQATSPKAADQSAWLTNLLPSSNDSVVSQLLQERVARLEAQLKESRDQSEELAQELAASDARVNGAQVNLLDAVRRAKQASSAVTTPPIKDLDTRVLVRAIISSPAVRAKYPDLLASLDGYLREYANQERMKGRQEAYSSVEALLERFIQTAGSP